MRYLIGAGFALIVGALLMRAIADVQLTAELVDQFESYPERFALQRADRIKGFRGYYLQSQSQRADYLDVLEAKREKLEEHRAACGLESDMQRASTYRKTLRCFRTEMALLQDLAMSESAFLEIDPGGSSEQREEAKEALSTLLSALEAIIAGIDADVYQTPAELLESRSKLLTLYREPAWAALEPLQVARLLLWTGVLIDRIEQVDVSGRSAQEVEQVTSVLLCLENVERGLLKLQESDLEEQAILDITNELDSCISSGRAISNASS